MDEDANILNEGAMPELSHEVLKDWYYQLNRLHIMDNILYEAQRQGRISFYMTSFGEEAIHIGSAATIEKGDIIYGQYRETGVFLYLGYTVRDCVNQCYGNHLGHGKGRQMPVHYGSKELNIHTISSPLGTQLPQAAGAAYAQRLLGLDDNVTYCYFGDGSASEGDAHPAFNFAMTLDCPVVFFCRNNGYAISTPTSDQYAGDGIASRAVGYGMDAIRVDGNDVMAVYQATKLARERAMEISAPVLVEAMTYRVGHHSTSDDSSAYRPTSEVQEFAEDSPIRRMFMHLKNLGLMDEEQDKEMRKEIRKMVLKEFTAAEKVALPSVDSLFEDVFGDIPDSLLSQKKQMRDHMLKYPNEYDEAGRVPSN